MSEGAAFADVTFDVVAVVRAFACHGETCMGYGRIRYIVPDVQLLTFLQVPDPEVVRHLSPMAVRVVPTRGRRREMRESFMLTFPDRGDEQC